MGSIADFLSAGPTPTPALTSEAPMTIGGFIGNIGEGLQGLAQGVGQVGGAVVHDALKTVSLGALGGQFEIPEIATHMLPAMAHDYATRYGPLFTGHLGAFARQVYDNPVSFGVDALTVASAAAKAGELTSTAALGGKEALKAGDTAATQVYQQTLKSLTDANVPFKTAKGAALRTAVESTGQDMGVASTLSKALPSVTYDRIDNAIAHVWDVIDAKGTPQERFIPTTTPYNPLTRVVKSATIDKVFSQSVGTLSDAITQGDELVGQGLLTDPLDINKLEQLRKLRDDALHLKMDRVETATMGKLRGSQLGRTVNKINSGLFFQDRLKGMREHTDIWKRAKSAPDYGMADVKAMGLHYRDSTFYAGADAQLTARIERQVGTANFRPIDITSGPTRDLRVAEDITPEMTKALEGNAYAQKGYQILADTKAYAEDLAANGDVYAQAAAEADRAFDPALRIADANRYTSDVIKHLQVLADPGSTLMQRSLAEDFLVSESAISDGFKNLVWTPTESLNAIYRPLQTAHGFEPSLKMAGLNETEAAAVAAAPIEDWRNFHTAVTNLDAQPPIYYPHMPETKTTRDWFMSRSLRGAVDFAKDPFKLHNTETLFKRGTYIRDPLEATARRAARGARMDGTIRLINAFTERGRPITDVSQLADGEVLMSPQWTALRGRFANKFLDTQEKLMAKGMSSEDAWTSAMYQVATESQDAIGKAVAEGKGAIKMYAVPEVMARHMNDAAKWAQIIPKGMHLFVDGPMNVWRSMVLAGSPRWIVNNVLGNSVFNAMQGAPVTRSVHLLEQRYKNLLAERFPAMDKALRATGLRDTKLLDTVDQALKDGGLYDQVAQGGFNLVERDVPNPNLPPRLAGTRAGQFIVKSRQGGYKTISRFQKMGHGVRSFNSEIEAAFRKNSFISASEKVQSISRAKGVMLRLDRSQTKMADMLKEGFTEGRATSMLNEVNHFMGDFSNLGPLERNIIRPYVVPFWGFYKFQAKLFLSFPFQYPLRAEILQGLQTTTQDLMSAYGPLPEWLKGSVPLSPPGDNVDFLTTSGPNPFSGTFQNPLSMLSPLIKMPLEQLTGHNSFTGRPFSAKDVIIPFGSTQPYKIIRNDQGLPIDAVPVSAPRPSPIEQALQQVPQYDLIKQLIAGGKTYDTSSILAGRGGAIIDPATGQPKYPSPPSMLAAKFLGFPSTSFNLGGFHSQLEAGRKAALAEALARQGAA